MLLLTGNIFAGRGDVLGALVKPPLLSLTRRQNDKVVIFARERYDRVGSLIVHKLTEKYLECNTFVNDYLQPVSMSFSYCSCLYILLPMILPNFAEGYKQYLLTLYHPLVRASLFVV